MGIYNAEISAGSLMLPESRRVARLLLDRPSEDEWLRALKTDNLLQKKSPATARRQARLIRNRLETMNEDTWELIADGEQEVAIQLLLATAIKHSQLLGDYLKDIYAERQRHLERTLAARDWEDFMVECAHRDASVKKWADSTKAKLFQVIVRILAEAKYIDSTRRMGMTPPILHPVVVRHLKHLGEHKILACMERT